MAEKLTLCRGVVGDLMFGTILPHLPRELRCQVAGRVALQVVVKVADGISLMRTQCLGKEYMRDLLTHSDEVLYKSDLKRRDVIECGWLFERMILPDHHAC